MWLKSLQTLGNPFHTEHHPKWKRREESCLLQQTGRPYAWALPGAFYLLCSLQNTTKGLHISSWSRHPAHWLPVLPTAWRRLAVLSSQMRRKLSLHQLAQRRNMTKTHLFTLNSPSTPILYNMSSCVIQIIWQKKQNLTTVLVTLWSDSILIQ